MISAKLRRHVSSAVSHNMRIVDGSRNWNKKCCTVVAWRAFLKKTRKLLGPGNRPAKLPKRLSGVSQSTRKLLTPENTSFSPVNFTGVVSLPNMVVYPKHIETPSLRSIAVGEEVINPSECARNIGVMLDQNLNMEQQITTICKSAFLHIRNIRKVRKYLPQHAAETVVNALVTSRLDNCNALLFGLPKNLLQKLQYVQNSAARLIMGTNKRDHIRPVLRKLHWLPIDNRIVFKILLLTFKARAKLAPQYIQDLINDYTPQRNLRSGSKCLLETPNYNLESYGKRAFSVAAPRLWNSLPMELKTSTSIDIFKKKLKTYLFNHSYF